MWSTLKPKAIVDEDWGVPSQWNTSITGLPPCTQSALGRLVVWSGVTCSTFAQLCLDTPPRTTRHGCHPEICNFRDSFQGHVAHAMDAQLGLWSHT